MAKVLGIGNALVDVMTRLKSDKILKEFRLPKASMQLVTKEFSNQLLASTLGLHKQQSSGGSAANTIHGLANLGINTGFIGKIGKDNLGKFFEKDMRHNGITPLLFHDLEETGRSIALISPDSERTFATFLGAAVALHEEDITSDLYNGYDYFHIEGYLVQNKELIKKALRLAKSHYLIVTLDMASYNVVSENVEFLKSIISEYVDVLFANQDEAEAYTGLKGEEALKKMSDECNIAVMKKGKEGSVIRRGFEVYNIGIHDVKSIDTTGAGDLYAAGFIYGLCKGLNLQKCGWLGALCGAYITEVIGAKLDPERWQFLKGKIREIEES